MELKEKILNESAKILIMYHTNRRFALVLIIDASFKDDYKHMCLVVFLHNSVLALKYQHMRRDRHALRVRIQFVLDLHAHSHKM